jgi:apolipoprotein D and lipocalin family protein
MANKEIEVGKGVDLKRYMGRWYEIASFSSWFYSIPKKWLKMA